MDNDSEIDFLDDSDLSNNSDEDSSSEEESKVQPSKKFQNNVIEHIKIDNQIRDLQNQIKELKPDWKTTESSIVEYLTAIDTESVKVNDGELIVNTTEAQAPLTKAIFIQALKDKIPDLTKVAAIVEHMETLRELKVKTTLDRKFTKDNKVKKVKKSKAKAKVDNADKSKSKSKSSK